MFSANEIYKKYLIKVNKNDTQMNIKIRKSVFVLMFNENKDKWYLQKLRQKNDEDVIDDLRNLKKSNTDLEKKASLTDRVIFKIPDDFFRYTHSYSMASKGGCVIPLYNDRPNPKNVRILLSDDNHRPSFEYEETLIELNNKELHVYKTDFDVQNCYLTYWSNIEDYDVEGYIKEDKSASTDQVDKRLQDYWIDEIINRCAEETIRIFENPAGAQLAMQRTMTEE